MAVHARSKPCGAKTRKGTPCTHPAGWGTDHQGGGRCKMHGGASRNGRQHGARDLGAQMALERFGGQSRQVSAEEALLGELYRAQAMVLYLQEKLAYWAVGDAPAPVESWEWMTRDEQEQAEFDPSVKMMRLGGNLAIRVTKLQETGLPPLGVTLPGASGGLTVHPSEYQAVLKWYMEERQQLAKTAKMCIDVKIEVRKMQMVSSMAQVAIAIAKKMAEQLGVAADDARYHGLVMTALEAAKEAA